MSQDDPLADDPDDEPTRRERTVQAVRRLWAWLQPDPDSLEERGDSIQAALTSTLAKQIGATLAIAIATLLILAWSASSRGPLATVLYATLFVMAATLFPLLIVLFGGAMPDIVGKLHLLLGAIAFDHHYLVQREHRWEWCPGERGRVWIDGEWHEIEGGLDNYSVLAWRPFGILRYKDADTWKDKRVDRKALRDRGGETDPTTDGGQSVVERGGIREVERPEISGVSGTWLLDLKRVFSRGIRKIGDIELIETAEEVIERGQVQAEGVRGGGPLVETIVGLVLGVLTGFGYVMLA